MTAVLRVTELRKRFGKREALRGVSFDLQPGECLGLLGPNGAGKTTLVRCLVGRAVPDSGSIELLGRRLPPTGQRGELGLVPQDIALYGDLSARENLEVFGRFHGVAGRELRDRVGWALDWTGLADRARHLVRTFSGGMKRRLNLACGVLHQPRVVLLDEPTVGVDPQSRQRLYDMLEQLRAAGASLVLTTHHLDEAETRCDRIVIVDHGQVIAQGTLAELVRSTLGARRRLAVQLVCGDDGRRLEVEVDDLATELPTLLAGWQAEGSAVTDLQLDPADLHAVFLKLTGRELRE